MITSKIKKISILLFALLALSIFSTGCTEKEKSDDLIEMTKAYIASVDGFYYEHFDLEKAKEELSTIIADDFASDSIEQMEKIDKGITFDDKTYTGKDALNYMFRDSDKVEMKYEISKVYDDLDPDRTYHKYVFVRLTVSRYDSDGNLFFQYTPIFKYFFVEKDGVWRLYFEDLAGYSNKIGEVPTKTFSGENVEFEEFKSFTIDIDEL